MISCISSIREASSHIPCCFLFHQWKGERGDFQASSFLRLLRTLDFTSLSFLTYILYQKFFKKSNNCCLINAKDQVEFMFHNYAYAAEEFLRVYLLCNLHSNQPHFPCLPNRAIGPDPFRHLLSYVAKRHARLRALAGSIGLEPIAYRLTAGCSTIELTTQIFKAHFVQSDVLYRLSYPTHLVGTGLEPATPALKLHYCIKRNIAV